MNLYLRFFWILIKNLLRKQFVHPLDEIQTYFRVFPNDLDLNRHMNNGRYLTIMDIGRTDFLGKTGLLKVAIKHKWFPILGAAQMIFLRPLKIWQPYTLYTALIHWDDKWFYISHRFESNEKVIAIGRVRGLLRGPNGNVPPLEALRAAGNEAIEAPTPDPKLQAWINTLNVQ
jgi:acyl-CoA thioesterase FadM